MPVRFPNFQDRNNKRKKPKKPKRQKLPFTQEREYQRALRAYVKKLQDILKHRLIPKLPDLYAEAVRLIPTTARQDSWADQFSTIINGVLIEFGRAYTESEIKAMALKIGMSTSQFNRIAMQEQFGKALGVDVFFSEPWLAGSLDAFVLNNYNLITSLEDRQIGKVNQLVTQGFQSGSRWEDISDDIFESFDVTESQADVIARDQVNKLNGEMTRLRQTSVGVTKYVWETVGDERVRDSHAEKDGKVFSWDNPPADTGNPGEDIMCRCTALPVLDDEEE